MIVGFPGETEADFEETCSFVRSLDLAYLHVFPYSARPDTPAALMPDQVDAREKDRRSHVLLAYAASQKQQFYARFVGTTQSVLVES